jgi:hypothetical protein
VIEAELRSGNPEIEGLCLALSDWSAQLRFLNEKSRRGGTPTANVEDFDCTQPLIE